MNDDTKKVQAGEPTEQNISSADKQIQELTETAKRAMADLQNYKKQVEKEQAQFVVFANAALLMELLPILDSFNRAFSITPDEIKNTDWFKGALQIEQQLAGVIKKQGVAEMPSQVGKKLNTHIHEPITVGPGEKDVIIEEFEKGYLLGEKVLRPAKVKVGNGS